MAAAELHRVHSIGPPGERPKPLPEGLNVVGVGPLAELPPRRHLLGGVPPETLDRGARVEPVPLAVEQPDNLGAVLDQRAKTLLAPAERLRRALALRDVAKVHDNRSDARLLQLIHGDGFEHAPGAVLVPAPELHRHGPVRDPEDRAEILQDGVDVLGMDPLAEPLRFQDLMNRVSQDPEN